MEHLMLDIACFEPLFDQFLSRNRANGFEEILVRDVVKCAFDVGIEHPFLGLVWSGQEIDFPDGIMATAAWSEPVARPFEPRFPRRFKRVFHHRLKTAV